MLGSSVRHHARVGACRTGFFTADAALLDCVFHPGYAAPAPGMTAGQGFGIENVRRVARLLGGDVTLGRVPGGGSRFVIDLPVRQRPSARALALLRELVGLGWLEPRAPRTHRAATRSGHPVLVSEPVFRRLDPPDDPANAEPSGSLS